MKLGNDLNANGFELKNALLEKVSILPTTPVEANYIYDTVAKKAKYYDGTQWVDMGGHSVSQSTTLTGEITGTGTGTVPTVANKTIITNKTAVTTLSDTSALLIYDSATDKLGKITAATFKTVMESAVSAYSPYSLKPVSVVGGINLKLARNGGVLDSVVSFIGKDKEVEVAMLGGAIMISLPDDVHVETFRTNALWVNGVEYVPYVHPTQSAININGSGLQFVQDITVNTSGHVTATSLGTISSASETLIGVTRLATATEVANKASGVAIQPSQVLSVVKTNQNVSIITGSTVITHNFGTKNVKVECIDDATGETIYPNVSRPSINTVSIDFGGNYAASTTILLEAFVI